MKNLILLLVLTFSINLHAGVSAVRYPDESFEAARARSLIGINLYYSNELTAQEAASHVDDLKINNVEDWKDLALVTEAFLYIRDLRFMAIKNEPDFLRRSSWMFPDDGCYVRAAISKENLTKVGKYPKLSKVFIFGKLAVKTKNSPSGSVGWWYHVALIARVDKQIYVLDPALEPKKPLELKTWMGLQNDVSASVSICQADTYEPWNSCASSKPHTEQFLKTDQAPFLIYEKYRLIDLGRDPASELGEHPPWLP